MMRSLSKDKFCDCSMSSILGSEKTWRSTTKLSPSIFKNIGGG